ncbi:Nucleotide-binding universal stress protein, UspA family [Halopenitus malekzadehii]|uniref:Nucleotide-binding universal stress protein, UspA family n=1 Tax=Halopenitus malekzadehii TaxID=1267564 RepID=A0A1H6IKG1_9EURY|nr:universal stress protein [Halopenitus malekzadehii]SEH49971.1 Nucleotide-binding universal stress protein, UspA family [Halopenitus malekzadehii]
MVIVAAVDDTTDVDSVSEGRTLAGAFNEELHVVHVRDREEVEAASGGTETVLEGAESDAADIASEVTDDFVPVGRIGDPAQELVSYTNSIDARYLVVGGRKQTPIGKALFGSVTQSVLLSTEIPVVTVPAE